MDLNWLLSATAQSAAAIIAIVGGFIVSKLIEISAEKKEITLNLSEIKDELDLKNEIYNKTYDYLIEIYSESIISDNIDDFINMMPYKEIIQDQILEYDRDEIEYYWNKALEVYKKLREDMAKKLELNSDHVPKIRITEFDSFEYSICYTIHSELERQTRRASPSSPYTVPNFIDIIPSTKHSALVNTRDEERILDVTNNEIKSLEIKQRDRFKVRVNLQNGVK